MTKSELEETMLMNISLLGLPEPKQEYRFHPERRWRFDGAYPEIMVAYEVEGGVYQQGRHNRPTGFIGDCEKYNEAARLGWCVLRFPSPAVNDGTAAVYLADVLKEKGATE